MNWKEIPFVPFHFFYYQFTSGSKRMFVFTFSLIVLLAGFFLFTYYSPFHWGLEMNEIGETIGESGKIFSVDSHYRSFDVSGTLYKAWTNYAGSPFESVPFPTIFFWVFQLVGWSLLLSASSFIRSRWFLLFFFLFGAFVHVSGVCSALLGASSSRLIEFGVIIGFLGLGYLFQMYSLKWTLPYRFGIFLGLLLLLFGSVWYREGWEELHSLSVNMFTYLSILSIIFLFFIAKEPTNALIYLSTNHRKVERRRPYGQIMIFFAVLLLWELFLALVQTNLISLTLTGTQPADYIISFFSFLYTYGPKPLHLIIISVVGTIFTSQNQFHSFRNMVSTVTVYTFVIGAWVILMVSFWFYISATGDIFFRQTIEELAIIIMLGTGIGHFFYLHMEFRPLLQARVNLYYLIGQGRGFRLSLLLFFGVISFVMLQGAIKWRSRTMLFHSYYSQKGDNYFLKEDYPRAATYYEYAVEGDIMNVNYNGTIVPVKLGGAGFSPKPNYNLATIYASENKINKALQYYRNASEYHYFPYAVLNSGNLLMLSNQQSALKKLWKKDIAGHANAYTANNLAYVYFLENKSDSALLYLKKSLLSNIDLSGTYSNMSEIYWTTKKKKEARAFAKASLETPTVSSYSVMNAIYYNQRKDSISLAIPSWKDEDWENAELVHNYGVHLAATGDYAGSSKYWEKLQQKLEEVPEDVEAISAFTWLMSDSVAKATSKVDYLNERVPEAQVSANYLMAVGYYKRNVPEMSRLYFEKMAEAGDSLGLCYHALTFADAGMADSAFKGLSALRVMKPELQQKVARELALLYKSHGLEVQAKQEADIQSMTFAEQMRMGIYADSSGGYGYALNAFRDALVLDSTSSLPFSEMVKIYRKYNNKEAISNGEYGLKKHPGAVGLEVEMVKAYHQFGQSDKASKLLRSLEKVEGSAYHYEIQLLLAEEAIGKKDTAKAEAILKQLTEQDKYRSEGYIRLAELYRSLKKNEEGYKVVYNALNYNTMHAEIWYHYAHFVRIYGIESDARYGATRAIDLSTHAAFRDKVSKEFEDILLIKDTVPYDKDAEVLPATEGN